jgi:hypothetical protein
VTTHLLEAEKRKAEAVTHKKKSSDYTDEIEGLEAAKTSLERQIRDAESTAQFRGLIEIERRREALTTRHAAVGKALEAAKRSRGAEERSCNAVLARLREVQRATAAAGEIALDASGAMRAIGLDPLLVPTPPAMDEPIPEELYDSALLSDSPGSVPQPVRRIRPPEIDIDEAMQAARAVGTQADRAAEAVDRQRTTIDRLLTDGRELDTQLGKITALEYEAATARTAEATALENRDKARKELSDQSAVWVEAQKTWVAAAPAASVPLGTAPARTEAVTIGDNAVAEVRDARRRLQVWAKPVLDAVREEIRQAKSRFEALSADRNLLADERRSLLDGAAIVPPEPSVPRDSRSERAGSPFYRLVDFPPDLPREDCAGLEGALQASGLLDAWVYPDGSVDDPHLADLIAVVAGHTTTENARTEGTLAAALTAVRHADTPVPASVVRRLLSSVGLVSETEMGSDARLAVTLTGRWSSGNMTGFWPKTVSEYVGSSAREATRARRIADLDDSLASVISELEEAQGWLRDGAEALRLWEGHVEHLPEPGELLLAHALATSADGSYQEKVLEAQQKSSLYNETCARWTARHDVLKRQATEAGLPYETVELARSAVAAVRASEACHSLSKAEGAVLASLRQVPSSFADFEATLRDREAVERTAAADHRAYLEDLDLLNGLIESLSLDDAGFEERLTQLRGDLEAANRRIPIARRDKEDADKKLAKLEVLIDGDEKTKGEGAAAVTSAKRELTAAASAPGLWLAATGTETPAVLDLDVLASQIRLFPDHPQGQDTILNSLRQLDDGLPSGQQSRLSSVGDVLAVHILGVDGWRSAAAATTSVRERLREDQEALDERYSKIFEEYLLRDLSEHLRRQIDAATALCRRMNAILADAETSQGVRVQLAWEPAQTIDADTHEALNLARKTLAVRQPDEDERLRRALQDRIEAERERHHGHYADVLARALDYRTWYGFSVKVQDKDTEGKTRNRRFKNLSAGETRFVAYIVMIAAAAAFYDALTEPGADPLRVVLLDEAFERLDDPTITRLLELLADLDMDWIITWPGGSAFSDKIEKMHVYDVLRRKGSRSIALAHTTWDGRQARRQS